MSGISPWSNQEISLDREQPNSASLSKGLCSRQFHLEEEVRRGKRGAAIANIAEL